MTSFGDALKQLGKVVAPIVATAAAFFQGVQEVADAVRDLKPLGRDGWAISTYGLMLAPEAHFKAASEGMPLVDASRTLEDAWSDERLRRRICSIVPYVYAPENRSIGHRRRELLERASDHFSNGRYEEAVLLVYSQVDGLFQDRAAGGDQAFSRLFSKRGIPARAGEPVRQFAELVAASRSTPATEHEFFLLVRDQMIEDVATTTLEDHPSRHGVLHGRVLGFGTRRRAAQAFAFLAAALELLVASWDPLPLTDHEAYELPVTEAPTGLQIVVRAGLFSPIRSVYLAGQRPDQDLFVAVEQHDPRT